MAFGWQSVGHFFASAAHGIVQAAKYVADAEKTAQAAAPAIESITAIARLSGRGDTAVASPAPASGLYPTSVTFKNTATGVMLRG